MSVAGFRPLRVLVLSTSYPNADWPRSGEVTERQTRRLADLEGIEVEVVAPLACYPFPLSLLSVGQAKARSGRWNGLLVHRPRFTVVPKLRHLDARLLARRLRPLLRRLRRRFPFDVIAAQYFWPDGPAAMRLARDLGVPFSIKARGPDLRGPARRPRVRPQLTAAARAAGGLLSVSGGLKEEMIGLGMARERIEIHYTGADRRLFHPRDREQAKAALGLDGPVLLVSGNVVPRKGQLTALEALALVPGATLLVAGRGPGLARLEARMSELGLDDRVRLCGLVPHETMPLLNAAADVTVLPTTGEGLANAWVDSLACGTPVVTTDVCGAREAIDRPEAGRIVANDARAIAAAIRELLADPPAPEAVARAADKFDWDRNARELASHLRRVAFGGEP
jgi:teichuronic acid biosynthesis glycosyltransferase TuaC